MAHMYSSINRTEYYILIKETQVKSKLLTNITRHLFYNSNSVFIKCDTFMTLIK